jgi:glyceraldehyde 3-phosphate dehydrogenase
MFGKYKVAINGFGRIGKQFLLACLAQKVKWNFIINELSSLDSIVYSLKHDSVHPSLKEAYHKNGVLYVEGRKIKVISESDPNMLPWAQEKVDLVVDCSGRFTKRELSQKHIDLGAKKVLISAPATNHDITIVYGINHQELKKEHKIVSAGSCTTNCITPLVKIINDALKIKSAYFTTTHAYTSTQGLIDKYDEKDFSRGRAASVNIVPTSSGASQSVVEAIPQLKGKLDGFALRVPVVDGSISTLTACVENPQKVEIINELFKLKSQKELKGILEYSIDQIVSQDIVDNPNSCIFDSRFTSVTQDLVSVSAWYDNEWGYSNRLVNVAYLMLKK